MGRLALGQVDGVQLFFHDVDEAQAVAIFLPVRTLRRKNRAVSMVDDLVIGKIVRILCSLMWLGTHFA